MHDTPHTKEGEQEDEEEEEEAAMEEAKETADRRKQSSTTLVVSLSMPAVGFIFSCTPVGHVGGRGGGRSSGPATCFQAGGCWEWDHGHLAPSENRWGRGRRRGLRGGADNGGG